MEQRIEIDGVGMRYDKYGSGSQEVIVMHGWGCKASTVDILAQAATGNNTTVYNLDLPGFGDSDEPTSVWGVDEYTSFVKAFADRVGIKKPVLIGHSFGGRISILYSSKWDTEKIILVDAAGIKPHRGAKYYFKVIPFKIAKKILPLLAGRKRSAAIIDKWRRKAGSSDYNNASPLMRKILSKVVNEDLTDRLGLISAPTLLIWGAKDTATPLSDAKKMEKRIPDAGLVLYPEAGHYSFLDRPAQTQAVIASFLKTR